MIEIIPNWHPIFVHFTVGLLLSAAVFFFLARFGVPAHWRDQWTVAAYWMLFAGAAITVVTVAAGWYAFNTVKHDDAAHKVMVEHRNWAIPTFFYFLAIAIWAWRSLKKAKTPSTPFLFAMVLGSGLLLATAWHGGELVFGHGLGVQSLPKVEAEGHSHGHGDEHADPPRQPQDASPAGVPPASTNGHEDDMKANGHAQD